MGLPAIGGLPSRTISAMYTSQNKGDGKKYTISEAGREAAIKELEAELGKGQITEGEYRQKKSAIMSAPKVAFVDNTGTTHKGLFSAENAAKKANGTNDSNSEINKLQKKFEKGEISPFEYRANMFMMTNPVANYENQPGTRLSILA